MLLEQGDHQSAGAIYQQVLAHEEDNIPAFVGFLKCLIADGRLDDAKAVLAQGSEVFKADKAVQAVAT